MFFFAIVLLVSSLDFSRKPTPFILFHVTAIHRSYGVLDKSSEDW